MPLFVHPTETRYHKLNGKLYKIERRIGEIEVLKCIHCDYKVMNNNMANSMMQRHLRNEHEVEFSKGFSAEANVANAFLLVNHIEIGRSSEQLWKCPLCKEEFTYHKIFGTQRANFTSWLLYHRHILACLKKHLDIGEFI